MRAFGLHKKGEKISESDSEPVWNLTETREKKKIAVVGISRGAGSTFLSVSLAFLLAMSKNIEGSRTQNNIPQPAAVSLLEMRCPREGESMIYYAAGLDRRFHGRRFTDFFDLYMKKKSFPQTVNLHRGINWAVWRQPGEVCDLSEFPLDHMPGRYIIADSPPMETLQQYDLVIAAIDPSPSAVYAGSGAYEQLRDMETCGLPLLWVLNKENAGVSHPSLKHFLQLREYFAVPAVSVETFCRAQYSGLLPMEVLRDEEKNLEEALKKLAVQITEVLSK